jgi:hypothetical protein
MVDIANDFFFFFLKKKDKRPKKKVGGRNQSGFPILWRGVTIVALYLLNPEGTGEP